MNLLHFPPAMTPALWQPPKLRQDSDDTERRATWLELFYDLVFVATVGQLSHYLGSHLSWSGLTSFILFFVPIWWCWVGATFYATRFDSDGLSDRFFAFAQMGVVVAMAVNVHHGLVSGGVGFALCYALFRGLLLLQYRIAGHYITRVRPLVNRYTLGFGVSILLWLISILVPPPWRYALWIAGLLSDFATPLMAAHFVVQVPPSFTHVSERVGLFTIIVLGEAVIGVVNGLANLDWTLAAEITALLGLTIAFSLWWLYFDSVDGSPLQAMKVGQMRIGFTWLYAHLPLTASLTLAGVGLALMVANGPGSPPEPAERWLFCSAIALALVVLAGLHWLTCTLGTPRFRKILSTYRLGSALFVMLLASWGGNLSALAIVTWAALACGLQVVLDLYRRRPITP